MHAVNPQRRSAFYVDREGHYCKALQQLALQTLMHFFEIFSLLLLLGKLMVLHLWFLRVT